MAQIALHSLSLTDCINHMKLTDSIHAIILTFNEERHIARCIQSLSGQCASVTVIDSGSTDATVTTALSLGAEVISRAWVNYAIQMGFAIDSLAARGGWLFRIDADEVVDADSRTTLTEAIANAGDKVDGLLMQRRIHFMGRRIRHGSIEPSWQLRLWRNGRGRCEQRWMDEHIVVDGAVAKTALVLSDINLNSLTWWTEKHNGYASREAIDILNLQYRLFPGDGFESSGASPQARRRRYVKERVYARIPPGGRALLYFVYRYILRLGFLDGREGLYFHLMQGLWYRTLVDAKVTEILRFSELNQVSVQEAVRAITGVDVSRPIAAG